MKYTSILTHDQYCLTVCSKYVHDTESFYDTSFTEITLQTPFFKTFIPNSRQYQHNSLLVGEHILCCTFKDIIIFYKLLSKTPIMLGIIKLYWVSV